MSATLDNSRRASVIARRWLLEEALKQRCMTVRDIAAAIRCSTNQARLYVNMLLGRDAPGDPVRIYVEDWHEYGNRTVPMYRWREGAEADRPKPVTATRFRRRPNLAVAPKPPAPPPPKPAFANDPLLGAMFRRAA